MSELANATCRVLTDAEAAQLPPSAFAAFACCPCEPTSQHVFIGGELVEILVVVDGKWQTTWRKP